MVNHQSLLRNTKNKLKLFAILIIAAMVVIGFLLYRYEDRILKLAKYEDLKAIATLKMDQIYSWKNERIGDTHILAEDPHLIEQVSRYIQSPSASEASKLYILTRFQSIVEYYGYDKVNLLSTDGAVLLSTADSTGINPMIWETAQQAIASKTPLMTDFYRCQGCINPYLSFVFPLENSSGETVAIIDLVVDPARFLYPLIQTWPSRSDTAETILVERNGDEVVFLNKLRFNPNSALNLKIPLTQQEVPAVQAVLGSVGFLEGLDYRDKPVVAYITPMEGTNWFMVSEVDRSELYAEIYDRGRGIAGLILLLAIVVIGITIYLHNSREKGLYKKLYQTETDYARILEFFRATLYSIGDAVIITDINGIVTQMNKIAEALTG